MDFSSLLDILAPKNLSVVAKDQVSAEDLASRIRVIVTAFIATGVAVIPITMGLVLISAVDGQEAVIIATGLLTFVMCLIGLLVLKFARDIATASHWYALTTLSGLVFPAMLTGGFWQSPHLQIIVLLPAWSFLMLGRRAGMYWSAVSLFTLVSFFAAYLADVEFVQIIPSDYLEPAHLTASIIAVGLVVLCMYWYDHHAETLRQLLHTERDKLAYQANHDDLTGLVNRKLFRSRMEVAIAFAIEEDLKAAVLYIDLDDFKPINDNHGHEVGDEVLTVVAERLKSVVRSSDTVARLGGDEFAILLSGIKSSQVALDMASKIVSALSEAVRVKDIICKVSGSVGVVLIPDKGVQVDALLHSADIAMYQAKQSNNRICVG